MKRIISEPHYDPSNGYGKLSVQQKQMSELISDLFGKESVCCSAPIRKENEQHRGTVDYVYTRICTKCEKPCEVTT